MDRYEMLGIPLPDPKTVCTGECEGTGIVPVFFSINLPPARPGEARVNDEEDETYRALWLEAEAKEHTANGWHFVQCATCHGTGKQP